MLRQFTIVPAVALASALSTGACGPADSVTVEREAHVYTVVIRALVEEGVNDVVYAGPLDDEVRIPLEVQAGVVEKLEDFATVRFVDKRSEAVDRAKDEEPVLEDGVLVLLAAVPTGSPVSLTVERYVDVADSDRYEVEVDEVDDGWEVLRLESAG